MYPSMFACTIDAFLRPLFIHSQLLELLSHIQHLTSISHPEIRAMEKAPSKISIFFKNLKNIIEVPAIVGDTLLETAHKNNIPLEGACEGNLACSTCHVICESGNFRREEISEKENDLLDMAYGLCPTSRLGCQIKIEKSMDRSVFEIPRCTRNMAVDGYKPPHH